MRKRITTIWYNRIKSINTGYKEKNLKSRKRKKKTVQIEEKIRMMHNFFLRNQYKPEDSGTISFKYLKKIKLSIREFISSMKPFKN